ARCQDHVADPSVRKLRYIRVLGHQFEVVPECPFPGQPLAIAAVSLEEVAQVYLIISHVYLRFDSAQSRGPLSQSAALAAYEYLRNRSCWGANPTRLPRLLSARVGTSLSLRAVRRTVGGIVPAARGSTGCTLNLDKTKRSIF